MCSRIFVITSIVGLVLISCPKLSFAPENDAELTKISEAEKDFQKGREALFQGNYKQAIKLLNDAVDADPAKISYRLYLARGHYYAENQERAQELLAEIIKTTPDHVEAGQLLAEIYTKQEKWEDVVSVLEPLLKYRHDYPTYHMLAEAKYNLNKYKEARKHFEEAVKLNPNSGSDYYQLGNIYLAGNAFALAAEAYQSALRLGIETPILHYKLGSAYFNLRNYFGKISVAKVKGGRPGTISEDWYLIEPVPGEKDLFHAAPKDSAVYQVAKAVADGIEDTPDIQFLTANIYLNARRYDKANEMFKNLEETIPKEDKALFYYYYAQSAFGINQYDEYLELLGEAIELDKTTYESALVDAYLKVADRHNQAGRLDEYIEFLAMAVHESPETASLHLKLGHAYEEAQKYAKAVAQWQMTLNLEPEHPDRMELLNLIEKYRKQLVEPASRKAS